MMYSSPPAWFVAAVIFSLAFLPMDVRAAEGGLRGAEGLLQEASRLETAPSLKRPSLSANREQDVAAEKLAQDIAGFVLAKPLLPEDAAKAWLDLLQRWQALCADPKKPRPRERLSFGLLVRCLPPPEAWKFIAEGLQSAPADPPTRLQTSLRAFAALLRHDDPAFSASLKTLEPLFVSRTDFSYHFYQLKGELFASTNDVNVMAEMLPMLVQRKVADPVTIPDLVALLGKERATAALRDALTQQGVLDVSLAGEATAALARRLAEEMIDRLGVPQWRLAYSLESDALFKALARRFGDADDTMYSRSRAHAYHLLGLIARGNIAEAVAFVEGDGQVGNLPAEGVKALRASGKSKEVSEFFDQLMAANPALPNWENYLQLSSSVGNLEEGRKLLDKVKRNPAVPKSTRQAIERFPWKLYLAIDQVDEGVRALRDRLARELSTESQGDYTEMPPFYTHGLNLIGLGRALHREELVDEGLRAAMHFFETPPEKDQPNLGPPQPNCGRQMAYIAEMAGRPAEAEVFLHAQYLQNCRRELSLIRQLERQESNTRTSARSWASQLSSTEIGNRCDARNDLVALAGLYGRQGRPEDVVALLDHGAGWHAEDLGEIMTQMGWSKTPLGYTAARALCDLGRKDEARRILSALLEAGSSYDPAYELFLELTPPEEVLTALARLLVRDPFELRPLFWKAEALKRKGDLDKAETAARAAIAIDLSDGPEGCSPRMRAYTTLADSLAAAGKDPEPYRSASRASRLAEEADELDAANLFSRAALLHQKALDIFPDAFCVHSHLAVKLASVGKAAEAEKHYRRAFELMPTSFDAVGNLCFECKDLFVRLEAQKTGEQVFARLADQPSAKAQVFYLLSNLRQEEGRYPEALEAARRAVGLDPDCLNAWRIIADKLSSRMYIPRAEQDAALLNILRLDPNRRHSSLELEKIRDLEGLWKAMAQAQDRLAPVHPVCYPLAASAAFETDARNRILSPATADAEKAADEFMYADQKEPLRPSGTLPRTPEIIARQELMHRLIELIDTGSSLR